MVEKSHHTVNVSSDTHMLLYKIKTENTKMSFDAIIQKALRECYEK